MANQVPVLVTGGAGYIGSHAVLALSDAGWPVAVIDNLTTGFRWAVPDHVPFYEGDIADEALLACIFAEQGTRAVMHFAGSIVVPESVTDPLKYYHNNTVKSRALLAAAVAAGVPHFIFSSTAATYGIPDVSPVTEQTPQRPINPYGTSKLMTELMLADVAAAHPLNYCALRYFNVAGADPAARTGQSTAGATHLIKVAVETVVGLRPKLDVFGNDYPTPDGTCIRDYIHVEDLADAHLRSLERTEPGKANYYNAGTGSGASVREVVEAARAVTGHPIPTQEMERRPGDVPRLYADSSKVRNELGWQPRYIKLQDIVASAWAWHRSHPRGFDDRP